MITLSISETVNPKMSVLAETDHEMTLPAFHQVWSGAAHRNCRSGPKPAWFVDTIASSQAGANFSALAAFQPEPLQLAIEDDPGLGREERRSLRGPSLATGADSVLIEDVAQLPGAKPAERDVNWQAVGDGNGRAVVYPQQQSPFQMTVLQASGQTTVSPAEFRRHDAMPPCRERIEIAEYLVAERLLNKPEHIRSASLVNKTGLIDPLCDRFAMGQPVGISGRSGESSHAVFSMAELSFVPGGKKLRFSLRSNSEEAVAERGNSLARHDHIIESSVQDVVERESRVSHALLSMIEMDDLRQVLKEFEVDYDGLQPKAQIAYDTFGGTAVRFVTDALVWSPPVRLNQFQVDIRAPLAALVSGGVSGTMQITLDPVELGLVRIGLHPNEKGIQVQIVAERPETLELMRRCALVLIKDLTQMGFADVAMEFSQHDNGRGFTEEQVSGMQHGDDLEVVAAGKSLNPNNIVENSGILDLRI